MSTAVPPSARSEIDVGSVLKRAWKLFADKPGEHVVAGLIVAVLGTLTVGILMGPLVVGYVRMVDKQTRGDAIAIGDVFSGMDTFVPALVAVLISGIGIFLGLVLFVLPGLVLMVIWGYALWFIAFFAQGPIEALGSSWQLFKANLGSVVIVFVLLTILNGAGSLVAFGVLLTFPFGLILATVAFRDLTASPST